MNAEEVRKELDAGSACDAVILTGSDPGPGVPDEVMVMAPTADRRGGWVVFYGEHGRMSDPRFFESEDAAGDYLFGVVSRPTPPGLRLSDEQRGELKRQMEENQRAARRRLVEVGVNPDTGRPLPSPENAE